MTKHIKGKLQQIKTDSTRLNTVSVLYTNSGKFKKSASELAKFLESLSKQGPGTFNLSIKQPNEVLHLIKQLDKISTIKEPNKIPGEIQKLTELFKDVNVIRYLTEVQRLGHKPVNNELIRLQSNLVIDASNWIAIAHDALEKDPMSKDNDWSSIDKIFTNFIETLVGFAILCISYLSLDKGNLAPVVESINSSSSDYEELSGNEEPLFNFPNVQR